MTKYDEIIIADSFEREAKRLIKRYRSLKKDLAELIGRLKIEPFIGADLGGGVRKIRLGISSKGKGKSGGARVIAHTDVVLEMMSGIITLLYIYDKSEQSTISDKDIQKLLKVAGLN